jgi:hypothetical protein
MKTASEATATSSAGKLMYAAMMRAADSVSDVAAPESSVLLSFAFRLGIKAAQTTAAPSKSESSTIRAKWCGPAKMGCRMYTTAGMNAR